MTKLNKFSAIIVILIVFQALELDAQSPEMRLIAPGWFDMGCTPEQSSAYDCDDDESPVRAVYIGAFEIGRTEVTQAEFSAIIPNLVSNNQSCIGPDKPMVGVSFYDLITYCNRLSIQEGLRPAYYRDPYFTVPFDSVVGASTHGFHIEVHWDVTSAGFRLPTEAEWEYAARAGTNNVFSGSNDVDDVAWTYSNSFNPSGCRDVGLKNSNAFGLFDMSGNVWEYCWDQYWYYPDRVQVRPIGPKTGWFGQRMLRGGTYLSYDEHVRIAERGSADPSFRMATFGFRLARGAYELSCNNTLIEPQPNAIDVSVCTPIRWSKSDEVISGYQLYIGTEAGVYDIVDGIVVQDTIYLPTAFLPENDSIFVKIVPFTDAQNASFCTEFVFETGIGAPIPLLEIESPLFDSVCYDYVQALSATGDTTLSFIWSTGDSTATTQVMGYGDFILEWMQEGCLLRDTLSIAEAENISVIGQAFPTNPGQATGRIDITHVSGGTPPYYYDWYYSLEVFSSDPTFFSHDRNLRNLAAGSYYLYMNDTLDCGSPFANFYFLIEEDSTSVSISNYNRALESTLFPNPVRGGVFFIQSDYLTGDFEYSLYDIDGRKICSKHQSMANIKGKVIIDLGKDLEVRPKPGIYFLELVTQERHFYHKLFIID